MKILIVEFYATGHYMEYIKHVLNGIHNGYNEHEFIFYLNERLKPLTESILNEEDNVEVNFLSPEAIIEFNNCKNSPQKSKYIWTTIFIIKSKTEFNHVLFMNINLISRSKYVLNPFLNLSFTFSGIFFQSPFPLRKMGIKKLGTRIKRELMLRISLINKSCIGVFLLNDLEGSIYYFKWSSKIKYLPDPINIVKPSNLEIKEYHNIPDENIVILHIGALGIYKGSLSILDSLRNINTKFPEKLKGIRVLYVGKMESSLQKAVWDFNATVDNEIIKTRNEFVDEEDFSAYLYQADCILIANRNVESSSGILNHALARKKMIIAPNQGYYRLQLNGYEGAYLFDENETMDSLILKAKTNFKNNQLENTFDEVSFCEKNSPQVFYNELITNFF